MLVPARRNTPEFLDDPRTDLRAIAKSGSEIATCNRLFGGTRALLAELVPLWPTLGASATLLDVGCGVGDLADAARTSATAHGVRLDVIAIDRRDVMAEGAAQRGHASVVADAFSLPLRDASVDIVIACQFLHHFDETAIGSLTREMTRVASSRVIISDLCRSWIAAAGIWLASWPLGMHEITRHDGFVSVLKGFRAGELASTIGRAIERDVTVTRRHAFRLTAQWTPR